MEPWKLTSWLPQPSHFGNPAFAHCGDVFHIRRRTSRRNGTEGFVNRFYGFRRWVLLAASWGALALLASARSTPNSSPQAEPRAEDEAMIRRVLAEQRAAWNQGAIEAFLRGYWRSPELTFSGSGGIKRGWEGVRASYLRNYPDRGAMGTLNFAGLEFRFLGPDAALVLGEWHLTRAQGDIGGVFTLVFQRFPAGWKIIHDHTSVVPPPDKK